MNLAKKTAVPSLRQAHFDKLSDHSDHIDHWALFVKVGLRKQIISKQFQNLKLSAFYFTKMKYLLISLHNINTNQTYIQPYKPAVHHKLCFLLIHHPLS